MPAVLIVVMVVSYLTVTMLQRVELSRIASQVNTMDPKEVMQQSALLTDVTWSILLENYAKTPDGLDGEPSKIYSAKSPDQTIGETPVQITWTGTYSETGGSWFTPQVVEITDSVGYIDLNYKSAEFYELIGEASVLSASLARRAARELMAYQD